jgi:hypothetical protein
VIPSGSSLDLAMRCVHSFTAGQTYPEQSPEVFAFGNAVHEVSERLIEDGRFNLETIAAKHGLGTVDRQRLHAVAYHVVEHIERLIADGWMLLAEVPLAYDAVSGKARILASRGARDYLDASATEFTATADIVGVRPGEVLVEDWKSGRQRRYTGVSWQLRGCGIAAARVLGADAVSVAMLYVGDEGVYQDPAEIDCFGLDEAATELRRLWHRIQAGPTPPVAGAHCTEHFCRGAGLCAATRAALAEMRDSSAVRIDTPADAARVWELLPQAEAALKAARARVREMAARQPIPLPNGRRLVVVQQERESIQLDGHAAQLVRESGAGMALEETTSKAAIERALAKPAARQLIAELREAGAVKTSRYDLVKEVDAADDAAE